MAVWCLCPLASSLSNKLGAYDGVCGIVGQFLNWGVPYLCGRVYFSDRAGLRELALGFFIGGLIYVPFCIWEVRMSPQLHYGLYGFRVDRFWNTRRLGGFRPEVFMGEGIALGVWMMAASFAGVWLWAAGVVRRIWGIPVSWLALALVTTTVLCRAVGALVLLVLGACAFLITKRFRTSVPLVCLLAIPPVHIALRSSGTWSGDALVAIVSDVVSKSRAASLATRLKQETILVEKAWQRPLFGWGAWARNRVRDERGRSVCATDGFWIIVFGQKGLVGLVAAVSSLLLPALLLLWRCPVRLWTRAALAPAGCLATVTVLFMIDQLMNGMHNPFFWVASGAVCGATLGVFTFDRDASMILRSVGDPAESLARQRV